MERESSTDIAIDDGARDSVHDSIEVEDHIKESEKYTMLDTSSMEIIHNKSVDDEVRVDHESPLKLNASKVIEENQEVLEAYGGTDRVATVETEETIDSEEEIKEDFDPEVMFEVTESKGEAAAVSPARFSITKQVKSNTKRR